MEKHWKLFILFSFVCRKVKFSFQVSSFYFILLWIYNANTFQCFSNIKYLPFPPAFAGALPGVGLFAGADFPFALSGLPLALPGLPLALSGLPLALSGLLLALPLGDFLPAAVSF